MFRLGITGASGFIGSHLLRKAVCSGLFEVTGIGRVHFSEPELLRRAVDGLDAVIHCAAVSRSDDPELMIRTNTGLTSRLADACSGNQCICLASTLHEARALPYHESKRESRRILESRGNCAILLMPNTFGPGSRPFYNSVVSTFCCIAAQGGTPERIDDVMLSLVGIDELCRKILRAALEHRTGDVVIAPQFEIALPRLWELLQGWRSGGLPDPADPAQLLLYECFRSYGL